MPASSAEVIGAALQSAYRSKSIDHAKNSSELNDQLIVSSKQVLLNTVEYDHVSGQQSHMHKSLKSKYVSLNTEASLSSGIVRHHSLPALKGVMTQGSDHNSRNEDQLEEPRVTLWPRDKVILGWRQEFPSGAGMFNLGNTCYMNSSLQALFHIPSLANWLLEEHNAHTQKCEANSTNASFCSICAMIHTLKLTLDHSNSVLKPFQIHNKLKCIGKTLMYGRQEDAHEFIKLLLDHMEKSYLIYRKATKLDYRSKETTPLNQIFGGYIRQQVTCPLCRHMSTTFSHFQDLVLDVRSVSSLDEALNLHFRKETLDSDNAYKCEKCHKKVSATKKHLIERAPHVLLIQLKRFTISGGKIGKHINIQKTIDISRFISSSGKMAQGSLSHEYSSECSYTYRLVAMVIHLGGSQHGGHYIAIAEGSSNIMFEFDDSTVRPISLQNALLRNPYILFYEMINKPKNMSVSKHIVRQSSEKTLMNHKSKVVTKPLPNSHSASSVVNGFKSEPVDILGEVVNRKVLNLNNSKFLSKKDRDNVSFKINSLPSKMAISSKPSKISMHSNSSLSKTQNSKGPTETLKNNSGEKTVSCIHNISSSNSRVSSLVPYQSESDDSETEKLSHRKTVLCEKGKNFKPERLNGSLISVSGDRIIPLHAEKTRNDKESKHCLSEVSEDGNEIKAKEKSLHVDKSCVAYNGSCEDENKLKSEKVQTKNTGTNFCQKRRSEFEKSISQDSSSLSNNYDSVDTASLQSKGSMDSSKSDKSVKSMKKSLLSFFTCGAASVSPDASPRVESGLSTLKEESSEKITKQIECNTLEEKSDSTDDDSTNSKRDRDTEETEPSSPYKKSCPDMRPGSSNAKTFADKPKKDICDHNLVNNKSDSECDSEVNFRLGSGKPKHKHRPRPSLDSNSNGEKSVDTCIRVAKNSNVISWSNNIKDLSHTLLSHKSVPKLESYTNLSPRDSSKSEDTIIALKRMSSFPFGRRVNTWDGGKSYIEVEFNSNRNTAEKRSFNDLYNEDFDNGKQKRKKKYRDNYNQNRIDRNPFQQFQNNFDSSWGQDKHFRYQQHKNFNSHSYRNNGRSKHFDFKRRGKPRWKHPRGRQNINNRYYRHC